VGISHHNNFFIVARVRLLWVFRLGPLPVQLFSVFMEPHWGETSDARRLWIGFGCVGEDKGVGGVATGREFFGR